MIIAEISEMKTIGEMRTSTHLNHANGSEACSSRQGCPALLVAQLDNTRELRCIDLKDGQVTMLGRDHQDVVIVEILFVCFFQLWFRRRWEQEMMSQLP
jgi:hypothetical protein